MVTPTDRRPGLPPRGRLLDGPHLALRRPVDGLAERVARLRPRVRALLAALVALTVAAGVQLRVAAAESRWGGPPVTALVATRHLPVGRAPEGLRRRELPPDAVPPGAVASVPAGATLALALPEGAVLTGSHLDPRGPAAGLEPGLRVVPFPVEESWAVSEAGWVDVWMLGAGRRPATLVARSSPVVDVRDDGAAVTALVGLDARKVAAATSGLALGRVLLAHAPPPARAPPGRP